jgi:hypothetical protein
MHCDANTVVKLLVRDIIPRFGIEEVFSADIGGCPIGNRLEVCLYLPPTK